MFTSSTIWLTDVIQTYVKAEAYASVVFEGELIFSSFILGSWCFAPLTGFFQVSASFGASDLIVVFVGAAELNDDEVHVCEEKKNATRYFHIIEVDFSDEDVERKRNHYLHVQSNSGPAGFHKVEHLVREDCADRIWHGHNYKADLYVERVLDRPINASLFTDKQSDRVKEASEKRNHYRDHNWVDSVSLKLQFSNAYDAKVSNSSCRYCESDSINVLLPIILVRVMTL